MEEEDLKAKIAKLTTETRAAPMTATNEGLVLHLVDRETNSVIALAKIKSVEYSLFSLMHDTLMNALERSDYEQSERIIQNYGR